MVKLSTDSITFDQFTGRPIGRASQGGKSYTIDYSNLPNIFRVDGFGVPSGMKAAQGPSDPDTYEGSSLRDIQDMGLELLLQKEVEEFGDGLYLERSALSALKAFQGTDSYTSDGVFDIGKSRWGYRPPVINHMAGGEDMSYHMRGKAVDLKLRPSFARAPTIAPLISVVVNAIDRGFRCIGFGAKQFHMDTRQVGGFMGYIYPTWSNKIISSQDIIALGAWANRPNELTDDVSKGLGGKVITPTLIYKLYLLVYSHGYDWWRRSTGSGPLNFNDVQRIVRDGRIPSVADSDDVTYYHISETDLGKYNVGVKASSQIQQLASTQTVTPSNQQTSTQTNVTPVQQTSTQTNVNQTTTTIDPFSRVGRNDLINIGILGAVIFGGYFGFKALLRGLRDRSERARYEREIRRLYSTKSRRELIGEFRMKHAGAISRARRDPRLARELEMKLARILAQNGYPIY